MRIVVALPAYNEEAALPPQFEAMARDLAGLDYEVIVVDDGSTDRTAAVTLEAAARMPVTLEPHPRNLGLAAAIRTCLAKGSQRAGPGDWVVTMDADNTHPPSIIRTMPLADRFNFCAVSRYAPGATLHGVPSRRVGLSELASWSLRTFFPVPGVRDYSSGYRAYRGDLLRAALERYGDALIESTGFAVQVEILLKLRRLGLAATEVPIDLHYERKPTPSKARMWHTVIDLARVLARDMLKRP